MSDSPDSGTLHKAALLFWALFFFYNYPESKTLLLCVCQPACHVHGLVHLFVLLLQLIFFFLKVANELLSLSSVKVFLKHSYLVLASRRVFVLTTILKGTFFSLNCEFSSL